MHKFVAFLFAMATLRCSGRPSVFNEGRLNALMYNDRDVSKTENRQMTSQLTCGIGITWARFKNAMKLCI